MTYTPQRLKSLSLYGTPFSSTRPLIDPLPAILHASAFSCSTRPTHEADYPKLNASGKAS